MIQIQSPRLYCASSHDDLEDAIDYINHKYCSSMKRPIFLVGSSMGSGLVANYLGEEGIHCPVKAAACIQPPLKIWVFTGSIRDSLWGIYDKAIAENLRVKFRGYANGLRQRYRDELGIDIDDEIEKMKYSTDLNSVTAKAFGFKDAEDYQFKSSCIHRLPNISTPTFILMSKDDPIIGGEAAIDYEACMSNPALLLGVTEKGGHLGYFESAFSSK